MALLLYPDGKHKGVRVSFRSKVRDEKRLFLDASRRQNPLGEGGGYVCIPPKNQHCIENIGGIPLILLCCCSPAYSHEDTLISQT